MAFESEKDILEFMDKNVQNRRAVILAITKYFSGKSGSADKLGMAILGGIASHGSPSRLNSNRAPAGIQKSGRSTACRAPIAASYAASSPATESSPPPPTAAHRPATESSPPPPTAAHLPASSPGAFHSTDTSPVRELSDDDDTRAKFPLHIADEWCVENEK